MDKLLGSGELLGQNGTKTPVSALSSKEVVGLYFSAHWCPPCRGFTPALAESYSNIKDTAGKSFEIVFVSSDRDEASFQSYFSTMPWLALAFSDRQTKQKLSDQFGVQGIPTLVLLDGKTGELITKDGRNIISSDAAGANFPWKDGAGANKGGCMVA